jgi:predicted small lipoprotein YifL
VNRSNSPTSSGWAIILLCATALALAGCGRKSGLDLPPGAPHTAPPHAATPQAAAPQSTAPEAAAPAADTEAVQAATPSVFNPTYGSDAPPAAPKGPKRPFLLDPLLD